jgi:hypothetical protein
MSWPYLLSLPFIASYFLPMKCLIGSKITSISLKIRSCLISSNYLYMTTSHNSTSTRLENRIKKAQKYRENLFTYDYKRRSWRIDYAPAPLSDLSIRNGDKLTDYKTIESAIKEFASSVTEVPEKRLVEFSNLADWKIASKFVAKCIVKLDSANINMINLKLALMLFSDNKDSVVDIVRDFNRSTASPNYTTLCLSTRLCIMVMSNNESFKIVSRLKRICV